MTTSGRSNAPFAVAVAVGPGDREVDRLIDLADSIAAHEQGRGWLVMVDDAPVPRALDARVRLPADITAISLHHPRHAAAQVQYKSGKGICSAVLLALGWIQANSDAEHVLKVDTDSLIIGPFRERIAATFATSPKAGVIGAYTHTPTGSKRDWTMHHAPLRNATRPPFSWRHPVRSLQRRNDPGVRQARAIFDAATLNGYVLGEHCMGGGYATNRELLDRMASAGHFDKANVWTSVDLPEDVMLGMHARAVGMGFENAVAPGALFGIRYRGLPFTLEELVAKDYAVIHAVKNDDRFDEATVRRFFQARRASAASDVSS
jgi:hypothetical protein